MEIIAAAGWATALLACYFWWRSHKEAKIVMHILHGIIEDKVKVIMMESEEEVEEVE